MLSVMSDAPSVFPPAFAGVDQMPDPAMLVRAMDETGEWPAVKDLRQQAIEWLSPSPGQRLLDVGCGPGDAALSLARTVAPGGMVAGVDASQVMVDEANRRAIAAGVTAEFSVGDAHALQFDDNSFDGCRSERTFQWLDDPDAALGELTRVTCPGGTVVVIDTDWGTFAPYHPDSAMTERIKTALFGRRPGFVVGRRLRSMFARAGLADVRVAAATHLSADWDPAARPSPPGFPPFATILRGLAGSGVSDEEAAAWARELEQTARDGHFFASLTMFGVAGRKPG